MAVRLPQAFIDEMHSFFQAQDKLSEWPAFLASFEEEPARAYRYNSLKIHGFSEFQALHKSLLEQQGLAVTDGKQVPWSSDGLYLPTDYQPGKSTAYRAGLFYIQEASAMLPAQVLSAKPGEAILDLCAAPGGKSARIAADLAGRGLLWSNDINAQRGKVLLRNLEQLGVANAIVTVAEPAALASSLGPVFDRVLVDAPCSGEGMFRRDPQARVSWEAYKNDALLEIQADLLRTARQLLKPGGTIVYSTCTFNRSENEEQIERFLASFPDFYTEDTKALLPDSSGMDDAYFTHQALRIWPHKARGDGHFVCLLKQKNSTAIEEQQSSAVDAKSEHARTIFLEKARGFLSERYLAWLKDLPLWRWRFENGRLHLLPEVMIGLNLPAVKFLKTGLFLAEIKETAKGAVIKPSHSFLVSLSANDIAYYLDLSDSDMRSLQYLRGESLAVSESERAAWPQTKAELWLAVLWEGQPLGWSKVQASILKNLYPPGWRNT